jgi:hypothetical protein
MLIAPRPATIAGLFARRVAIPPLDGGDVTKTHAPQHGGIAKAIHIRQPELGKPTVDEILLEDVVVRVVRRPAQPEQTLACQLVEHAWQVWVLVEVARKLVIRRGQLAHDAEEIVALQLVQLGEFLVEQVVEAALCRFRRRSTSYPQAARYCRSNASNNLPLCKLRVCDVCSGW